MENTLPQNLEDQLSDLERRHRRHNAMLNEHYDRKHRRREEHHARRFALSIPPNTLI